MGFSYLTVVLVLAVGVLYSMWSSSSEAKIKDMKRRDKNLKKAEGEGYKISKRWDCNAITIFADKKQKVLSFLVMAWRKDTIYHIPVKKIKSIKIEDVGVVKRSKMRTLITEICLNIDTEDGPYVLRTLYVKGIGLRKTSPHVAYARKCAEEICEYVDEMKK